MQTIRINFANRNAKTNKKNNSKMNTKLLFAAAMTAMGLASCGHGGHNAPPHGDEEQGGQGHSDEIVISTKQAAAMGIASEKAGMGAFCPTLAVSGMVMEASGDERTVAAPTAGIVRLSRPLPEGARLGKGMTAMTIDASQIEGGSPAEAAEVAYRTALADYERAKKLLADKLVSEKDYNAAKAAYESARLAREATPASRGGIVSVASPMAGYVKTCYVNDGDYVTVGQQLLSATQNRRIYLRADLPERHYELLGRIHSATFRTAASDKVYDLDELGGKLIAAGKSSEATPGYIPVTFELNNAEGILPGAFAEIWLKTDSSMEAMTLPVEAVTEEQGTYFVYVQDDSTCYRKQRVTTGMTDGKRIEITSGLKNGERVVTRGAMAVKLASVGNAIPAHTHNH